LDNYADILALKLAIINNRKLKFNFLAFTSSSSSDSNKNNCLEDTNCDKPSK